MPRIAVLSGAVARERQAGEGLGLDVAKVGLGWALGEANGVDLWISSARRAIA